MAPAPIVDRRTLRPGDCKTRGSAREAAGMLDRLASGPTAPPRRRSASAGRRPHGNRRLHRAVLLELARRGRLAITGLAHRPVTGAEELAAAGVDLAVRSAPLGVVWQQVLLPAHGPRGRASVLWSPITTLPVAAGPAGRADGSGRHRAPPAALPPGARAVERAAVSPPLAAVAPRRHRHLARDGSRSRPALPLGRAKTHVVHCGVDPEFVPGRPDEIAETRAELETPDGYPALRRHDRTAQEPGAAAARLGRHGGGAAARPGRPLRLARRGRSGGDPAAARPRPAAPLARESGAAPRSSG